MNAQEARRIYGSHFTVQPYLLTASDELNRLDRYVALNIPNYSIQGCAVVEKLGRAYFPNRPMDETQAIEAARIEREYSLSESIADIRQAMRYPELNVPKPIIPSLKRRLVPEWLTASDTKGLESYDLSERKWATGQRLLDFARATMNDPIPVLNLPDDIELGDARRPGQDIYEIFTQQKFPPDSGNIDEGTLADARVNKYPVLSASAIFDPDAEDQQSLECLAAAYNRAMQRPSFDYSVDEKRSEFRADRVIHSQRDAAGRVNYLYAPSHELALVAEGEMNKAVEGFNGRVRHEKAAALRAQCS